MTEETKQLRVRLIQEEFDELKEAMATGNLAAVAKDMADLLYVTYGTAMSYGISQFWRTLYKQVCSEGRCYDNTRSGTDGLIDQVAIVTGGGRGIGRAIAEGLAQRGCQVVVADINSDEALESAAGDIPWC